MYPFFCLRFGCESSGVFCIYKGGLAGAGRKREKYAPAGDGAERMCDSMKKGCDAAI